MKKLTKSKLILQASISTIIAALAVVGIVSAATTIGTNISTGGTLTVSGANTFSGSTTLGDAATDVNLFTGTLQASTTALFTNGLTAYSNITLVNGRLIISPAYSLDVSSAGALNIGTSTATSLTIGNTGAITAIGGRLTIPAAYSLDVASAGALNIGTTTANAITIGKSGITTTFPGDVTVSGTFSPSQTSATEFYVGGGYGSTGITLNSIGGIYANGSSTINGILTVGTNMTAYGLDRPDAGILGIGTSTATTIAIGHTGATTTIGGNLTIPAGYTFDAATAGALYIGTSSANAITIGKSGITTTFPGNVTVTGTLTQGNTQLVANSLLVGGGYGSTGLTIDDLGGLYTNGSTTIGGLLSVPAHYGLDVSSTGTLNIGTTTADAITIGRSGITTTFPGNTSVTGTDTVTNASTTRETIGNGTTITGFLFGSCSVDFGTSIEGGLATTTNCTATGITSSYKVFMTPVNLEQNIVFHNASSTGNNVIQVQAYNTSTSTPITTAAHTWNWMAIK